MPLTDPLAIQVAQRLKVFRCAWRYAYKPAQCQGVGELEYGGEFWCAFHYNIVTNTTLAHTMEERVAWAKQ